MKVKHHIMHISACRASVTEIPVSLSSLYRFDPVQQEDLSYSGAGRMYRVFDFSQLTAGSCRGSGGGADPPKEALAVRVPFWLAHAARGGPVTVAT
ncbi:hypothetical protein BaRGS_00011067 [Batillaria attramentaria]|uniref:Uncharacterized protein n=1 Tax=Batillaria attramentaria TaxID=370345 RepID=A0ABD0LDM6_9CAEN